MRAVDKVWVVTGGASGMGRELVLQLLQRGGQVAAVDVRPEGLATTAELAGARNRLSTHTVDITDRAAVDGLLQDVLHRHGRVDGLINNAGIIQPFVPVLDLDDAALQRVLDVNLMGTIHMTTAFLPTLLERPQAHLANVSSMGGFFPFPGQTVYGASKAAVKLLTEGLYAELLDSNVTVSVIMPGAVATDIALNSGVTVAESEESSRMPSTSAQKAARTIIDGLEKDRLHIYATKDARLMNLAVRIAPGPAIRMVQKQMSKLMQTEPAVDSHR